MPKTRRQSEMESQELIKMLQELSMKLEDSRKENQEIRRENQERHEELKKENQEKQDEILERFQQKQEEVIQKQEEAIRVLREEVKAGQDEIGKHLEETTALLHSELQRKVQEFEQVVEEEVQLIRSEVTTNKQETDEKIESIRNEVAEKIGDVRSEVDDLRTKVGRLAAGAAVRVEGGESLRIKPPKFDGKASWSTYLSQFEAAAEGNLWSEREKARYLMLCLRGEATEVLRTIPTEHQQNYELLIEALEMRYGEAHLQQVYQAQLKSRRQRTDESLQQLEADVARMVNLAYPSAPIEFREQIAISCFVDAVRDWETSQALRLARHKNLPEALAHALVFEAATQTARRQVRLRQVRAPNRKDGRTSSSLTDMQRNLQKIAEVILQETSSLSESGNRNINRLRCWNCGEEGHLKRQCPNSPRSERNQENSE